MAKLKNVGQSKRGKVILNSIDLSHIHLQAQSTKLKAFVKEGWN